MVEANRARLASLKVQREEEAPLISERKEINDGLRSDLKNLKRQQTALTNDIDVIKRERNVLAERIVNPLVSQTDLDKRYVCSAKHKARYR